MSNKLKGVIWSAVDRFSVQIIQFITTLILARILSPEDFGIIAIVLVVMNILQVFNEVGFGAALMQKLDRDELDFSTVFIFNIFFGLFLYFILYIFAPFFSSFFLIDSLTKYIRLLGFNIIISSFIVVQRTILLINVDFKTQAKASFIGIVIGGGLGIFSAINGLGVLSIIIQQLVANFITAILIWKYSLWKPSLKFSYFRFKILFNYAHKLILARFINTLFNEIYSISIGKFYNPLQLGYFNRAKSFISLSTNNLTTIVQRVSVPLLCQVQNDNKKLADALLGFINKTAFIVFPLLFGIFILSKPIVLVLLGEKWLPSVWILQVLCPIGLFYVYSTFNLNIFNVTGNTSLALKSEIIKKILNILIIIISITISFEVLVISQIFIAIIEFFIDTWFTNKQIGLTRFKQVTSTVPVLLISSFMALSIYIIISYVENNLLKLLTGSFTGVFVYGVCCFIFNICNFKKIVIGRIKF